VSTTPLLLQQAVICVGVPHVGELGEHVAVPRTQPTLPPDASHVMPCAPQSNETP
jgi:hypothetical protein